MWSSNVTLTVDSFDEVSYCYIDGNYKSVPGSYTVTTGTHTIRVPKSGDRCAYGVWNGSGITYNDAYYHSDYGYCYLFNRFSGDVYMNITLSGNATIFFATDGHLDGVFGDSPDGYCDVCGDYSAYNPGGSGGGGSGGGGHQHTPTYSHRTYSVTCSTCGSGGYQDWYVCSGCGEGLYDDTHFYCGHSG